MVTIRLRDATPDWVKVFVPYNPAHLNMIRTVPGRRWDADDKCWLIPRKPIPLQQAVDLFTGHTIQLDPGLKQFLLEHAAELSVKWPQRECRLGPKDRRLAVRSPATDRRAANIAVYMARHLRIRNYSPRTIKTYTNLIEDFAHFFDRPLREINNEEIYIYLSHLVEERHVSSSRVSQAICALKFLYGKLFGRNEIWEKLDTPRKNRSLPFILDREEIIAIFKSIDNRRHRLMLEIMYASGLRVSEVSRIRIGDVDLKNLALYVRGGKGRKDRVTMLSEKSLGDLSQFVSNRPANEYLFEGWAKAPISPRAIQKVFHIALEKSGIQRKASCHTLRHSFATHLMENGTALPYIRELLGHKSIKTTEIYTHVRRPQKSAIRSPF